MKTILLNIVVISFILLTKQSVAQAPELGTASNFAIFSVNGAFENNGTTDIVGDIGTNAGAFSGFPPGTVNGQTHVADVESAQAAKDVDTAYAILSRTTCGTTIGTTLGNNQVLTPDVYCINAITVLNGDLILDGEGDPNALFIIKINAAFSTTKHATVIMKNSASFLNVYWQINGAFELADSSVFRGTLIANGAISLLEFSSVQGRALSSGGSIYLHNNSIATNTQLGDPLPIDLLSFNAHQIGDNVQFDWSTATETNNNYFTVTRSKDAVSFEDVLKMNGEGNSNKVIHYSALMNNSLNETFYYQLKQTDYDGKTSFSNIVMADYKHQLLSQFIIYPNPFSTSTPIMIFDVCDLLNCELNILNSKGEIVIKKIITNKWTPIETNNLPAGIYLYKVMDKEIIVQSGELISQK